MVAEMASFGASKHLEEGDGDIPPPDLKGNLTETENSSSDNSESTEESSEEEEDDDDGEEEGDSAEGSHENSRRGETEESYANGSSHELSVPGTKAENHNEVNFKPCCEKCKAIQNRNYELVTPRNISRGRLQLMLQDEGTYQCSVTGLVLEVSQRVLVRYSVLSWSRFGTYLSDSWKSAGPIFDVDCDPSILKSIQFPHSLCLADQDSDVTFSVLHVKNSRGLIEPSADHSGSHIKWSVTSLSPVGPIVQTTRPAEHHGVVLVYKEACQQTSYSFRVYLATNNHSDIKDVQKEVRSSKKRYVKMEKPPTCQRLLEEKKYRLISEPEGDITPEDFQFTLAVVKMKGYFEAFFEQPPPFKLSLVEADSDQTVWTATIREGDCVDKAVEKPRKQAESRKRSTSTSEEELTNKRPRWGDESDGLKASQAPDVTDSRLMQVAKRMGKEWKQVAIGYLGLSMQELEEIQATDEDLAMHKFKMLERWRRRQGKGKAGLKELWACLDQDDVPNEVLDTLQAMLQSNPARVVPLVLSHSQRGAGRSTSPREPACPSPGS